MIAQGGGSIVLFSSRQYLGAPGSSAYGASTGGVVSLMHSLAFELGKHGIRVNAIAPGFTETPMTANRGNAPPPSSAALGRNAQPAPIRSSRPSLRVRFAQQHRGKRIERARARSRRAQKHQRHANFRIGDLAIRDHWMPEIGVRN